MKFPNIEEEEIVSVIKNMKNGKATGVDGISAELMKLLIKDDEIRKHIVKCFNSVLRGPSGETSMANNNHTNSIWDGFQHPYKLPHLD